MAAAFALTPAQHVDVVLNFNNKVHRTIYNGAIAPLPIDPFDCVQSQLMDFMAAITKKARDYGWSERIMLIPKTLPEGQDTEYLSMLTQHAQIPIDLIREYELSYVQNQTRERQDSFCLYTCVMDSLSQEGRAKVLNEESKYKLPLDPADPDSPLTEESGNLLLKVILIKSSVDNRSGAYSIRMKMAELDVLIVKLGFDIEKFNLQVRSFVDDLNRRGETSSDLSYNLIKAYKGVPIKEFIAFIDRMKDDNDGNDIDDQHTPDYIMDKAENKYKILVNENTWDTKLKENDDIMAIKAELSKLKKQRGNQKGKKSSKKKAKAKRKVDITRKPADVTKPVTIEGRKWYWCSAETGGKCHGVLRRHKPSECKGMANAESDSAAKKRSSKVGSATSKRLKVKANEALLNGEGEYSDSELSREQFSENEPME